MSGWIENTFIDALLNVSFLTLFLFLCFLFYLFIFCFCSLYCSCKFYDQDSSSTIEIRGFPQHGTENIEERRHILCHL